MVQLLAAFGADALAADDFGDARSAAEEHGHYTVVAWLDAVVGWPAFRIAVSLALHRDATIALRLGRIDPDDCARSLVAVVASAAGRRTPETVELVRLAFRGWTPHSHWLHKAAVREAVRTVLTVSWRLHSTVGPIGSGPRRSGRFSQPTITEPLPLLPPELWLYILGFLTRRSWGLNAP